MKFVHIVLAAALSFALAACTPTLDFKHLDASLAPPEKVETKDDRVAAQKLAICEWGDAAGLPHTGNKARASIVGDRSLSTSTRRAYVDFDKRVVGTSKAYECLCTEDEERRRLLQCTA